MDAMLSGTIDGGKSLPVRRNDTVVNNNGYI